MSIYQDQLAGVMERDPRYAFEAYEFVVNALTHAQQKLGNLPPSDAKPGQAPQYNVSGRELVQAIRDLAVREFGLMARIVFKMWGISRTSDFGEIVFTLVEENLISKAEHDKREEFDNIYDLDQALVQDFRIDLDEAEWSR